jgi:hypothetical protein
MAQESLHVKTRLHRRIAEVTADGEGMARSKDPPPTRALCPQSCPGATVASLSRVGGLHHPYEWRDAA